MDAFKKKIQGFRGRSTAMRRCGLVSGHSSCSCCRETTKEHSRKLARHRLKAADAADRENAGTEE